MCRDVTTFVSKEDAHAREDAEQVRRVRGASEWRLLRSGRLLAVQGAFINYVICTCACRNKAFDQSGEG